MASLACCGLVHPKTVCVCAVSHVCARKYSRSGAWGHTQRKSGLGGGMHVIDTSAIDGGSASVYECMNAATLGMYMYSVHSGGTLVGPAVLVACTDE